MLSSLDHWLRLEPSGCASTSQHPFNARVHLFFFNEFATCNLVNTNLYLCFEPIIMGEHLRNSFLDQIVSPSSCLGSQIIEFGLLTLWQMYFHGLSVSFTGSHETGD
jgi:hypothetical protein